MQEKRKVREIIMQWLEEHQLKYQFFEHPQADTIAESLKMPFINDDITVCKNVFLCNRKKSTFFLMLLSPETPFRSGIVSKALGVSRLSFAPEDALFSMLRLTSGSVSPFGLFFDKEHEITLCYETAVKDTEYIAFHPCDNTATLVFTQSEFWERVLPALGVSPVPVENAV